LTNFQLAYLVSLIEHSDTKFNFKVPLSPFPSPLIHTTNKTPQTAPLPPGRSVIACERMVGRLKTTLSAELAALKAGVPLPVATGSETPRKGAGTGTPRKRKVGGVKGEEGDELGEGSPKKKGRKKKGSVGAEVVGVKKEEEDEVKEEEGDEEGEAEEI
jgi:hypothetical protein